MRLVIELGYQYLVFPAGADVSAVVLVRILPDNDPSLPDAPKSDVLERLLTTEKELAETRSKLYTAEQKLKAVTVAATNDPAPGTVVEL